MPDRYSHLERRIADEQQTFARPLRTLVRREAVVCESSLPVHAAAVAMRAQSVGSLIVTGENGSPAGIFTSSDLLAAFADNAGADPVAEHMSRNLLSLPAHALVYEAALVMIAHRVRHVLVTEDTRLVGVVSERDLFSLQRLGMGEITTEIRAAGDIDLLSRVATDIRRLTSALVERGVSAEQLISLVSVLNDKLTHRAIDIVRSRHDLERISWCWLAFGSEGRLEQTFTSDQDNGLLFAPHDDASPEEVRDRLLPFARDVNQALDACGFALCRGNIMASNPELCLSLPEWREKMGSWIEASLPQALLEATIYFDFRPLYGDDALADQLRTWVFQLTRRYPVFLRAMAENATRVRPALGRFGGFATEDVGGANHSIDIKAHGARIFIDVARILSLAHGVPQTNTAERLYAVREAAALGVTETASSIDAFHALQAIRLRIQSRAQGDDLNTQNRVNPDNLGRFDRLVLKESLRVARELQEHLALEYRL